MSHAVVRGAPTAAQRYVDSVLTAAGTTTSLPAVLLHCLSSWPDDLMMINGANGEHVTNGGMLGRALRIARMLRGRRDSRGTLMLGANSPALVAAELGSLFAGSVTLSLDVNNTTIFELEFFLKIWPPAVIFCDPLRQADVLKAVHAALDYTPDVILLGDGETWLEHCAQGYSDQLKGFMLPAVSPGDTVFLVPTTGSTGPPKAAMMHHKGLIAQLLNIWSDEHNFPQPYRRAMVFSTAQWIGFWTVMTSAIVARVTLIMTSRVFDPAHAWEVFNKYEVDWVLLSTNVGARLLEHPARAKTLRRMLLAGSRAIKITQKSLQDRLPEGSIVRQGYGMTECHAFFATPHKDTPFNSVGKALNVFDFKIVDDKDQEVGPNQIGELCLKSDCIIKSYVDNEEALRESLTADGWLRTGDRFTVDEAGNLYFIERSKFCFKVDCWQVSPEELESIIGAVAGVRVSAVCGVAEGAAALVVRADPALTRATIHQAIDSRLTQTKRLRGGIAFVPELPLTHNGKLHRRNCIALAEKLHREKQLYV